MSSINKFLILLLFLTSACTPQKSVKTLEHGMSYMGPVERNINLKLSLNKSSISKLTATVSVPYNYGSTLHYKWKLGPNVVLEQGTLVGTISSLQKNQAVTVAISVKNFNTDENRFVRFEVFGTDPQKRIFSDGIVSSNQPNSFENIVQEVEKINAEK